ncbi:hypothetical protein HGD85_00510 [Rhodobacteraceae bacterium R_SAG10]|nr:hypothetical protein [Rhodobacteraceae bacterium R_SAG10]
MAIFSGQCFVAGSRTLDSLGACAANLQTRAAKHLAARWPPLRLALRAPSEIRQRLQVNGLQMRQQDLCVHIIASDLDQDFVADHSGDFTISDGEFLALYADHPAF